MAEAAAAAAHQPLTSIADRLAAEASARKADRQLRQEQALQACDPRENTQAFLRGFTQDLDRLTSCAARFEEADAAPAGPSSSSGSSSSSSAARNALLDGLLRLEQSTSQAAYFLPQYDLRQCLASIQGLRQRVEAAGAPAHPRKRFAFRSSVPRTTAAAAAVHDAAAKDQHHLDEHKAADAPAQGAPAASASASASASAGREGCPASVGVSEQDLQLVAAGHGLMGLQHATLCPPAAQLQDHDYVLADLRHCTVHLVGQLKALRVQGLQHCRVVAGPVTGATFIDGAQHCHFQLASYQVRIHHVASSTFRLRTRSRPVIERCSGLLFGPLLLDQGPAAPPPSAAATAVAPAETAHAPTTADAGPCPHADSSSSSSSAGAGQQETSAPVAASVQQAASCAAEAAEATEANAGKSVQPTAAAAPPAEHEHSVLAALAGLLEAAQLADDGGQWRQVDDFDWVKSTPSPHWRLL